MSILRYTLIQSNLTWEDKEVNRALFSEKINSHPEKMELVILPETFTTGFSMNSNLAEEMNGETFHWMKQIAKEKRIILCGSFFCKEDNHAFNRLVWMLPNGQYHTYDKRHVFTMVGEDQHVKPGDKRFIAQVNGWKICTIICYDLRFPVWSRMQSEDEYDALLVIANWPEKRKHAWESLLIARAIENQCFVIAVNRVGTDGNGFNYSGESCVINPLGEVLYKKSNVEDVFTIELNKQEVINCRTNLPFQKDKDIFAIL
jgi:omega-amidase